MSVLYQNIWAQGDYIYHTTTSGIDVYNNTASALLYDISTPDPAAIWANDTYIYIGTLSSGVYRAAISGTAAPYKQVPDITANSVVYLHGSGDYLCVSTVSGVDRYKLSTSDRIYTLDDDINKCFQTSSGTLYYLENSSSLKLHVVYLPVADWAAADYIYDSFYGDPTLLTDIYVTENTSQYSGGNVIFLATNSGINVIEERPGNEANGRKKYFFKR